jgi:hypothetical protein
MYFYIAAVKGSSQSHRFWPLESILRKAAQAEKKAASSAGRPEDAFFLRLKKLARSAALLLLKCRSMSFCAPFSLTL